MSDNDSRSTESASSQQLPLGRDSGLPTQRDVEPSRASIEHRLFVSEETLRIACEAAEVGIWHRDVESGKEVWSSRYCEMYGFDPFTEPNFENWLAAVHPDDRALVLTDHRRMLEGRISQIANEFRVFHPSGVRWIREVGRNVFDSRGQIVEMVGIAMDITERRAREEAMKLSAQRKDEFLSMIAHELRNSLSVIVSALNLSKRGGKPAEWTDTLIRQKVKSLTRLIGDLLDLARITEGKVELSKQAVAIVEVAREILEQSEVLFREKSLTFSVNASSDDLSLWVDPVRFEQMLTNLVHNACKFTPQGGSVGVRIRREPHWMLVEVEDNGVGIDASSLESIFDLYTQLGSSHEASNGSGEMSPGLGIGLSVVKQLVSMHGGSVAAESKGRGQGSRFTLRFPVV